MNLIYFSVPSAPGSTCPVQVKSESPPYDQYDSDESDSDDDSDYINSSKGGNRKTVNKGRWGKEEVG